MKKILAVTLTGMTLALTTANAQADSRVSVGVIGGTTGLGADASWRFHDNFAVTARYTGGLDWSGDYDSDDVEYQGDIDLKASTLKLDYFPFAGRFYLTAGIMLPDMEANVRGNAKDGSVYEFNGATYSASDIGTLNGTLTIADGIQPYAGIGWRSSHKQGFGFFSELGVMATNIDVSLSSSNNYEGQNASFRRELRQEEQRLKDDVDKLSFYPVALIGVTYTF